MYGGVEFFENENSEYIYIYIYIYIYSKEVKQWGKQCQITVGIS